MPKKKNKNTTVVDAQVNTTKDDTKEEKNIFGRIKDGIGKAKEAAKKNAKKILIATGTATVAVVAGKYAYDNGYMPDFMYPNTDEDDVSKDESEDEESEEDEEKDDED